MIPLVTILTDQPIECAAYRAALGLVVVVWLVNDTRHGLGAHGDPDQDGHVVQEALECGEVWRTGSYLLIPECTPWCHQEDRPRLSDRPCQPLATRQDREASERTGPRLCNIIITFSIIGPEYPHLTTMFLSTELISSSPSSPTTLRSGYWVNSEARMQSWVIHVSLFTISDDSDLSGSVRLCLEVISSCLLHNAQLTRRENIPAAKCPVSLGSILSNPHLTISPALSAMATLEARTLMRAGGWPDTEDTEDMLTLCSWARIRDQRRRGLGCKMR